MSKYGYKSHKIFFFSKSCQNLKYRGVGNPTTSKIAKIELFPPFALKENTKSLKKFVDNLFYLL